MRCSIPKLLLWVVLLAVAGLVFVLYFDLLPEHDDLAGPPADPGNVYQHEPRLPGPDYTKGKKIYLPPDPPTDLPVVLWWTPFTPYLRSERTCSVGACLFTQSRTEFTNPSVNVSAIVFYGSDFDLWDLPLPRRRVEDTLWALLHEESPKNNWMLSTPEGISLFNITATVSRYSHYPLTLHYLHTVERLLRPPRTPTHLKSRDGLGLVAFLQSTCNPPSDRDVYVAELMRHISVDCYGKCLHNRDLPRHLLNPLTFGSEEVLDIMGKYKFVLSFENALCYDYITEKFWRPLYAGSVPIVRGSPTIRDWDPSITHPSIIVADDFSGPEALAKFLLELDKNDTEYNKYLSFKKNGVTNKLLLDTFNSREWAVDGEGEGGNFIEGFECFICNTLYERRNLTKKGMRGYFSIANSSHYDCPRPRHALGDKTRGVSDKLKGLVTRGSEVEQWVWEAKCAEKTAKLASTAISRKQNQQQLDKVITNACMYGVDN